MPGTVQFVTPEEFADLKQQVAQLAEEVTRTRRVMRVFEWITPAQAVALLGSSKSTVSRLCRDGELESVKEARTVRIRLESVEAYLSAQPAPRREAEAILDRMLARK